LFDKKWIVKAYFDNKIFCQWFCRN
jgi:hypothetical protein